jgi:hypothetical protein
LAKLAVVVVGGIIFLAGIVFTLQGFGAVGPPSSTMYNNSFWIYAGIGVFIIGLLVAGFGVRAGKTAAPEPAPQQ